MIQVFLKISGGVWIIIAICIFIAFALVCLGKGNRKDAAEKGDVSILLDPVRCKGVLVCALIAVAATVTNKYEHYVGSPMAALIIGMLAVNLLPITMLEDDFKRSISDAGKKFLSTGIVFLGATLSFIDIFSA